MKKIVLLLLAIIGFSSCSSDYTYKIVGNLTNLNDQTIYAVFENDETKKVDTVTCKKPGRFVIKEMQDGFNSVTLYFEGKSRYVEAYLEKGKTVSVKGDVRYPMTLNITGGSINDDVNSFRKKASKLLLSASQLNDQLNAKGNGTNKETELAGRIANINIQLEEMAQNYIRNNRDKETSAILIKRFFSYPEDTRKIDELLALLDPKLKNFYVVRQLEQYSARSKRTSIGAEAPNFDVKNIYGENISLDSFPERYLLLAFTAPWCDMCQTEDLELDKLAAQYPSDSVSILLISLDNNPSLVRDTLKKDKIHWNLVTDSAGQAARLIDLYNVSALPKCFLIDEEGKIILKSDNGVEIKQTLKGLFEEE